MEASATAFLDAHGKDIRIILVESHTLICSAVRRYCVEIAAVEVVAVASSIGEALLALEQIAVQVIVLTPSASITDCLSLATAVPRWPAGPGILAIQTGLQAEMVSALALSGVHGVLSEAATERDLAMSVAMVAEGNTYMDRRTREQLAAQRCRHRPDLTERERDVLALLMHGFSNLQIARALTLSTKTVEMHLTHIYEKLHVHSRTEAVVHAEQFYGSSPTDRRAEATGVGQALGAARGFPIAPRGVSL